MKIEYTFETNARTIELLGRKQIRDGTTAINELLKNAHDADSDYVEMHFGTGKTDNDAVIIADHGYGMSHDEFLNKWLILGTPGKSDIKETKKGRPMLGAKGVGRLSVEALGSELLLIDRTSVV